MNRLDPYYKVVKLAVDYFADKGFKFVTVDDGMEEIPADELEDPISDLLAVDVSRATFLDDAGQSITILIVLGNAPGETIADGSCTVAAHATLRGLWEAIEQKYPF